MNLQSVSKSFAFTLVSAGLLAQSALADVTVVIVGGNASRNVAYERAESILTGATKLTSSNANLRSYVNGNLIGNPGLGKVTIHFALIGAAQGLLDLKAQNSVSTLSGNFTPQLAISGTFPETIGLDSSAFTSQRTLVVPFVFIKNPALPNTIAGVTNLTQRQAAYLEASSGSLPTAFFGGESTTDVLYLVGRNTGAAVRQVIDANVYFTGTPAFWVTNSSPNPVLPPIPDATGQSGGANVAANIGVIPNAIGTVASGDIGTYTALSYEGIPFTPANVANGSYPIWGYEAWYYKNSGAGLPSANQLTVLHALINAVADDTYQHTAGNAFATGKYVPLNDLQVDRSADGGPITSTIY